jgi:sarcosine oxidase subunit gamma
MSGADGRRSPLGRRGPGPHLIAASDDAQLLETPFLAQVSLRADPAGATLAAVQERFGLQLPTTPNRRASGASGTEILWLGPDEWLFIARADGDALAADVEAVVRPGAGTVVNLSSHRTALEVRGPGARDILASGTSVDLHPSVFGADHVVQAPLARAAVILSRRDAVTWRVLVRTSFARYLADWLADAITGT